MTRESGEFVASFKIHRLGSGCFAAGWGNSQAGARVKPLHTRRELRTLPATTYSCRSLGNERGTRHDLLLQRVSTGEVELVLVLTTCSDRNDAALSGNVSDVTLRSPTLREPLVVDLMSIPNTAAERVRND